MAKAIALARTHAPALPLGETLRVVMVTGCGLALVLAGPALPF
ncbi:hypothetical protein [Erythrobacter sp. SD-21]|nr:hypothetical protein [Erythrobacter sp. SD-21]EDL49660.1 hypothetical protein ED21_18717 [Erythrobacter sp. SD-21]